MNSAMGLLPVDKPSGITSFDLVRKLRRLSRIQKIGHAGTLDPFATGVMILLIGKPFTTRSDSFLNQDKEYLALVHLGSATDTYDREGVVTHTSSLIPSLSQIEEALSSFQGTISQVPPMFSAKKVGGKKLYELARKGVVLEREAVQVTLHIELLSYTYPSLQLRIACSKGTYIRSLAHDLGAALGCAAHLSELQRTRSGPYLLSQCVDGKLLDTPGFNFEPFLLHDCL
jgi:tRNA pseudouridine55 synthase